MPSNGAILARYLLAVSIFAFVATWLIIATGGLNWLSTAAFEQSLPSILNIPNDPDWFEPGKFTAANFAAFATYTAKALSLFLLAAAAGAWIYIRGYELPARRFDQAIVGSLLACLVITAFLLVRYMEYEGDCCKLADAIYFRSDPPFTHRILFPAVARGLMLAVPSWGPLHGYLVTQFLILACLFPLIYVWCRLNDAPLAMLGATLLLAILVATASYHTFYDRAIVLFFTLGLILLYRGYVWTYIATVALATLNHEIILLLILLSGALLKPFRPQSSYDWRFVAIQVALHALVRVGLAMWLPVTELSSPGRIWVNIYLVANAFSLPYLFFRTLALMLWFGVSLFGLRYAPPFLRTATLLFPMLVATTLVFGQINEARQFIAFAPVSVALMMCLVRGRSDLRLPGLR